MGRLLRLQLTSRAALIEENSGLRVAAYTVSEAPFVGFLLGILFFWEAIVHKVSFSVFLQEGYRVYLRDAADSSPSAVRVLWAAGSRPKFI